MKKYKEKQQIRWDVPQVGVAPYRQIHAHSTGNPNSTAQNEADYLNNKDINLGFYTHVVGNGSIIQVAPIGQGAYDVGGGWNCETFAAVELIESHQNYEAFRQDYEIYIYLLRALAMQGNIPLTLDTNELSGIKTHCFCTNNQPDNYSDHIDPLPYLSKWGISLEQFKKDIEDGIVESIGIMTEIVKTTEQQLWIKITHYHSVSMLEGTIFNVYLLNKQRVDCEVIYIKEDTYKVIVPYEQLTSEVYQLCVEIILDENHIFSEVAWYPYYQRHVNYQNYRLLINHHRAGIQRI